MISTAESSMVSRQIDQQLLLRNKSGPNLSFLRRRCPLSHPWQRIHQRRHCLLLACSRSESQNARAFSKQQQSMHVFSSAARAVETTDWSSSETGTYRYRTDPGTVAAGGPRCRNKDRVGACPVRRPGVADGASHAADRAWRRKLRHRAAASVAGVGGGDPFGASGTRCDGSQPRGRMWRNRFSAVCFYGCRFSSKLLLTTATRLHELGLTDE